MYMIMSDGVDKHHVVYVERDDIEIHELDGYTTTLCNEYTDEWWAISIAPRETVLMCGACLRAMVASQQLALKRVSEIGPDPA